MVANTDRYFSTLGHAKGVIKASGGTIVSLKLRNRNSATRYAFLFNAPTAPADGTVDPFDVFLLPAQSQVILGDDMFHEDGVPMGLGISVVISSTDFPTLTAATDGDHDISGSFL